MDVRILETAQHVGESAATEIAAALRHLLAVQASVRIVFAAAPSQSPMLAALLKERDIEWPRIEAFHMDEYFGLPQDAPQRFGNWLIHEFFSKVPLARIHLMQPELGLELACEEYASLLGEAPIDLVLLGIGTNGHLAFNDPPADLHDPRQVKVVTLDTMCREQQVFDRCFETLDLVPRQAMTLTVPALLQGKQLFGCVLGAHKREAARAMLEDPISGISPATALRQHPRCTMFLDRAASNAELV